MPTLMSLNTFSGERGILSVLEDYEIPFEVKRIFYIYKVNDSIRGGHRHKKTQQALVCLKGKCLIKNNDGKERTEFMLENPKSCLILEPEDWHTMEAFSDDCILLVVASHNFDTEDYIFDDYDN